MESRFMQPYETLGLPSPDECIGIGGLTVSLAILTVGIVIHLLITSSIWSLGLIIVGLFIGWVSFMYCVVWGEDRVSG